MDILEETKRNIQEQYESIRDLILSERKGIVSQNSLPNNHILTESRKAYKDHYSNNSRSKYLGRLKIFTSEGEKILPCNCEKQGLMSCDIITHTPSSTTKKSIQLNDELFRFEKSLKSVRSQKYFRGIHGMEDGLSTNTISKKRELDIPEYFTNQTGSCKFKAPLQADSSSTLDISSRFLSPDRLRSDHRPATPADPIYLRPRLTPNNCSFCLKKCNNFTCETCEKFTRVR